MASLRPSLRTTETYTESNFLRLHTTEVDSGSEQVVTLEHLSFGSLAAGPAGWSCLTIVDGEKMTRQDAVFIARSYAAEYGIPVIYESHSD